MGIFSKINFGLTKTRNKMAGAIDDLFGDVEEITDDLYAELEEILVMSDVGVATAVEITERLKKAVSDKRLRGAEAVKEEIKAVFGDAAYKLNISSTKSMTGHLLGAAGAVEAMACVLSVKNDIVPTTINHEEGDDDPELDYNLNFTFNKAQKREVRAALSNTFGFGGHNCCVVFKKYAE